MEPKVTTESSVPSPDRRQSGEEPTRRQVLLATFSGFVGGWAAREYFSIETDSSELAGPPGDTADSQDYGEDELRTIEHFVEQYEKYAETVEEVYGVPADAALAMAILEADYGHSELAKNAHNFHGLKANSEWSGDTYTKPSIEHVDEGQLEQYGESSQTPIPLGNGMYEIVLEAEFKRFSSDEEGFLGFGDHLRTRFNGEAYADAFEFSDPEAFILALFDENGAKYATDIAYQAKVLRILDGVRSARGTKPELPEIAHNTRGWNDLTPVEQEAFRNNTDEYQKTIRQLALAESALSRQGYREFESNVRDVSEQVRAMNDATTGKKILSEGEELVDDPRLVLHYTVWPEAAWGHDGIKYTQSMINHNQGAFTQFYLDNKGHLHILTADDQHTAHAFREYSREARGIEMPAYKQSDITPAMYEGLAYTISYLWRAQHPDIPSPSYEQLKEYVIGHGEITELRPDTGNNHLDFPRVVADYMAHLAHKVLRG